MQPSPLESDSTTPIAFELVARGTIANDGVESLCCPDCQITLDLHQPDIDQPAQLIGTCGCCSRWFLLVEIDFDGGEMLMLELPSAKSIRLTHSASSLS